MFGPYWYVLKPHPTPVRSDPDFVIRALGLGLSRAGREVERTGVAVSFPVMLSSRQFATVIVAPPLGTKRRAM